MRIEIGYISLITATCSKQVKAARYINYVTFTNLDLLLLYRLLLGRHAEKNLKTLILLKQI